MSAEWIAIGITLLLAGASAIKSFGYDKRRLEQLETEMKRSFEHHTLHFAHGKDEDAHWTRRERDDLQQKLDVREKLDVMHNDIHRLINGK